MVAGPRVPPGGSSLAVVLGSLCATPGYLCLLCVCGPGPGSACDRPSVNTVQAGASGWRKLFLASRLVGGSGEGHRERGWASREQVLPRHDVHSSEPKETRAWSRGRGRGDHSCRGGVVHTL